MPDAIMVKAFNTMAQELFELAPEPLRDHHVLVFVASDDPTARQTVMKLAQEKEIGFVAIDSGVLRNVRQLESMGDFIRFLTIGQQQGIYATISVNVLPAATSQRLGGRQASSLG